MSVSTIPQVLEDIKRGKMVILVDNEERENEGDLTMAAELVTPEAINFMARYGRGLICLTLTDEYCDRLLLPPMTTHNSSSFGTAFTVSIEARVGVTTGISAADRARTIQVAVSDGCVASDLARPGHIFPLRARPGGVLERAGQTEGSVDLARLAGLKPAGVICEIMNDDGTMARMPQLKRFALEHSIKICTIDDLIAYRLQNEAEVKPAAEALLPTKYGEFKIIAFENNIDGYEHLALVKGNPRGRDSVLVRLHSECLTGDAFGSMRCDCGRQLEKALRMVAAEDQGIVVYLRQEGRGIGLTNKLKAYALQESGKDTVEANEELGFKADQRDYRVAALILKYLGVDSLRLMTNNPTKISGLAAHGIKVTKRIPIEVAPDTESFHYLMTKKIKMGHLIGL